VILRKEADGVKLALDKYVDNVASLLTSVLRWLENADEDERWWQLQTQVVQLCLLELGMVLQAEARRLGTESDLPLTTVLPKINDMVNAMLSRNRTAALQSGTNALDQLLNLE
jgi:hypothetical protein